MKEHKFEGYLGFSIDRLLGGNSEQLTRTITTKDTTKKLDDLIDEVLENTGQKVEFIIRTFRDEKIDSTS